MEAAIYARFLSQQLQDILGRLEETNRCVFCIPWSKTNEIQVSIRENNIASLRIRG